MIDRCFESTAHACTSPSPSGPPFFNPRGHRCFPTRAKFFDLLQACPLLQFSNTRPCFSSHPHTHSSRAADFANALCCRLSHPRHPTPVAPSHLVFIPFPPLPAVPRPPCRAPPIFVCLNSPLPRPRRLLPPPPVPEPRPCASLMYAPPRPVPPSLMLATPPFVCPSLPCSAACPFCAPAPLPVRPSALVPLLR